MYDIGIFGPSQNLECLRSLFKIQLQFSSSFWYTATIYLHNYLIYTFLLYFLCEGMEGIQTLSLNRFTILLWIIIYLNRTRMFHVYERNVRNVRLADVKFIKNMYLIFCMKKKTFLYFNLIKISNMQVKVTCRNSSMYLSF